MRLNNFDRKLTYFWTKDLKPLLGLDLNQKGKSASGVKVEVVIPCLEKDLKTLPLVVESLRKFLKHPLGNIYIVSPVNGKIALFCKRNDCIFIDEAKVAPLAIHKIDHKPGGEDRAGWIFQQLIKLNADNFVKTANFLVWDADTTLTKPQSYSRSGLFVINHSDEFHRPYFQIYRKLMGEPARSKVSFVSHQMIWSKKILIRLKSHIERHCKDHWYNAIVDSLDPNEASSFSEYELYGNYLNNHYPAAFMLEYWFNHSLPRTSLVQAEQILKVDARDFKSVSWHSYN